MSLPGGRLRIVFIGTVEFSLLALEQCLRLGAEVVGVITRAVSPVNADFADLTGVAEGAGIPCLHTAAVNGEEAMEWIASRRPDIIFCFGWSALIGEKLLTLPPMGVLGFHPAALPRNRGRHPLIWALALGLDRTASSFFFMDQGADSGDILSQREVEIRYEDDARALYDRVAATALEQITEFLPGLMAGTFTRTPQDHSLANVWRKRSAADGCIDFRMPSRGVYNLVRALARPYVGAHAEWAGRECKIWKAAEADGMPANLEPGKVLAVSGEAITVKCGDGAIVLLEHDLQPLPQEGEYL